MRENGKGWQREAGGSGLESVQAGRQVSGGQCDYIGYKVNAKKQSRKFTWGSRN